MLRLALIGVGTATFQAPNNSTIMNSVPPERLGTASASVATARNIGTATGLALAGTILVAVASARAGVSAGQVDALPDPALLAGIRTAFLVGGAVTSLAIVSSLLRGSPARSPDAEGHLALKPASDPDPRASRPLA